MILFFLLTCLPVLAQKLPTSPATVTYGQLLLQLQSLKARFTSGYFRYTCDATFLPPLNQGSYPKYLEFAFKDNKRYSGVYANGFPGSSTQSIRTKFSIDTGKYVFDAAEGHIGAHDLVSANRLVSNPQNFAGQLCPMDFGYTVLGFEWFADFLQKYPGKIISTSIDAHFGPVVQVETTDPHYGITYQFWFALHYGYLCVHQLVLYRNGWQFHRDCQSAIQERDLWIPMRGVEHDYMIYQGKLRLVSIKQLQVLSFHTNDVSDTLFMPQLPTGSLIHDFVTHHDYLVGANGQLILDPRSDWNKNQPYFWRWAFILSLTALFFFLVSFIVYRQRRPRLKKG
jgi:hypothetical protein